MSILVTGAAGYIGSNAVLKLLNEGYNVIAIDRNSPKWIKNIPRNIANKLKFIKQDISHDSLSRIFRKYKSIKGVLHFAGDISVPESVSNPEKYYENNLWGTYKLLQQCRKYNVNNFIFSSSACVYGEPILNKKKQTIKETESFGPLNPYGETKMMVEMFLQSLSTAYDFRHCSLRYFNVVGNDSQQRVWDGHWKEKSNLFPALMRTYLGYTPDIRIFGDDWKTEDGTCVRDYIHVTDLVDAHILALRALMKGAPINHTYNVGTGRGYSVMEVVNAFEQEIGNVSVVMTGRREGDAERVVACPNLIRKDLKWKPKYTDLNTMVKDYAGMICTHNNDRGLWREKQR